MQFVHASNSMLLQIETGLTHLGNMIDKMRNSQTGTNVDFSVYCEKEIVPYCVYLQACFQTVTSFSEKLKEEYEEKMEIVIHKKSQADEKLRSVSWEQKHNETKLSNCEDQINEANNAQDICLTNIKVAYKSIHRLGAEIKDARSQQYLVGGITTIAGISVPLAIPVLASFALLRILKLEKKKHHFANLRHEEESYYYKLRAGLPLKKSKSENMKKTSESLQKKIREQEQIIQDLNTEIPALVHRINFTVDVLQMSRNVCRSVDSVSVAMNVLKLETTNAYALEPLITPILELNTNLYRLFSFFQKPDRDKLENKMAQIEDKLKRIQSINFNKSPESFF